MCDGSEVREPCLPTIDVIARLALRARRSGQPFRLEHAGPALLGLLQLCGLVEVVGAVDDSGGDVVR